MKISPVSTVSFKNSKDDKHRKPEIPDIGHIVKLPYTGRIDAFYSPVSDEDIKKLLSTKRKKNKCSSKYFRPPLIFDADPKQPLPKQFDGKIFNENLRQKNALDMQKIMSITLPKSQKIVMRPFEESDKKFTLDRYQKEAIDSFISGKNTIVTAPTGTGKTLIAEYGIEDALKKGERIIYLSPLKALSNEKFTKFSELFGEYFDDGNFASSEDVGIITGDTKLNTDARLLVMTTEIYRNILNGKDPIGAEIDLEDFSGVIYDEFHYIKDTDRGMAWEESVIKTPKHMRQLMLTATASNADEISQWISSLNPAKEVKLVNVPENERYVPLKEYMFGFSPEVGLTIEQVFKPQINIETLKQNLSDRQKQTVQELESLYEGENYIEILSKQNSGGLVDADKFAQTLVAQKNLSKEKAEQIAYVLSDKDSRVKNKTKMFFKNRKPSNTALINILNEQNKLPALFFVFSKKGCKKELDMTSSRIGTLLKPEESKRILDVVNEAKSRGIYFGENFDKDYLPKLLMGYCVHHAGMLPTYKSLVEKLAREGLIKVCFATETLAAGINMPFKTVVFTSLEKYNGKTNVRINPTLYKQASGRAGRRGIDDIGNVIVMPKTSEEARAYKQLMESSDTRIQSAFSLAYASILQNSSTGTFEDLLNNSLYNFQKQNRNKINNEAQLKLKYLEEKGYITKNENGTTLTYKGQMAKDVWGINQIFFTELISNPEYTEDMSPAELAALMVIFADVKDDRPKETFNSECAEFGAKAEPAINLSKQILEEQRQLGIDEPIKISTNLAQAVLKFAQTDDKDRKSSIKTWNTMFNELAAEHVLTHEGDLLRVFNGTIDLLKTITEVSDDWELAAKAEKAIELLNKPPVTDILEYELDIK